MGRAAVVGGTLTMLATAAPAQAAAPVPASAGAQHCVIVAAPLEPGQTVSRVLSHVCADTPASAQRLSESANPRLASTLLLVLYENIRYNTDSAGASTQLRGSAGPCDTEGYGFGNLGSWGNRISSFKRFNWCQRVAGYDYINYGGNNGNPIGIWTKDTDWVGAANDRIESILTRRL
jgi:hypothetical protein